VVSNLDCQIQGRRRAPRVPKSARIRLSWNNGFDKYAVADCLNISRTGLGMLVSEPIPVMGHVCLQSERLGLSGSASVRYCRNYKAKYIIGIDFVRGLEWRPTEDSSETQWLAAPTQGASDLATV
jgi:hypothetical protein